jgi:serine/threonine protein kinase
VLRLFTGGVPPRFVRTVPMFCLACHFATSVSKDVSNIGHVRLMNASPLPRSPEALFPPAYAVPEPKLRRSTDANAAGGSSPSPDQAAMLERRGSWSLNDFDIGPKLGEGQFGKIYLCREKTTKYAVVLKLIAKEAVIHNALVHQIQREIELHMYCKHRNIVRLLAYFWDDERVFLVLDYADEGNLSTLLQRVPEGQRLSEWAVRSLAGQLCSAVLYLHRRGILHRDIKPDNILFKKGCLKLADFTWAVYLAPAATASTGAGGRGKSALLSPVPYSSKGSPSSLHRGGEGQSYLVDATRRRRRTTFCGTLDYLPPELVMQRAYDEAADMWCVGATVYEMIVGRPPFEAVTMRETEERIVRGQFQFPRLIRDQLSWEAMDFVSRLLQIDPTRRMTAEQAARHPFVAGILEQERQRSLSTGRHRSAVPSSIFLPPTAANDGSSQRGERIVRQHIHPLQGTAKTNESSKGALHYSGVSVSACTTINGGNNASGLSAAHPGNTSSSMVAPHPHATSTSVAGVSQMSHIAHHSGMASSAGWLGESAGGTTLTNSQLPSNVTQASTQEGHDDAVAAAGDAFPLSVPDVSNITAAPVDDAIPPPADVERALEFDMALVPMHESNVDGPSVTLSVTTQPVAADDSATPGPPTPHTPVQAATNDDHIVEDDMAPDVSAVMMATSALPSPVPARRPSAPSPTRSDGADSFQDDGEPIDISAIGAW